MQTLYLMSLGCNKNLVDSEIMLGRLKNYKIIDDASKADVIIINTCGFIQSAKQESIRAILELDQMRKNGALLIVTGCLMQRYAKELMATLPEVDLFAGVGDYAKIDELIAKRQNSDFSAPTFLQTRDERVITGSNYHAFIKISEGCNQKCAFCAIPSFKGRLKSRALDDIIIEVKNLVKRGYYDFSFIGQDTSSYLLDQGQKNGLISLIDEIERIPGIKIARILYLYPSSTSPELIERIAQSKVFANYFDMPIQHISANMLKIMRRNSSQSTIKSLLAQMRAIKDSFLRTGVIVGHPGESQADFNELCEFLENFNFDRITAFAYSRENDTLAYDMPQLPQKTINARLKSISKITHQATQTSFKNLLGKRVKIALYGPSSEGEFFYGAKLLEWDRQIDGEILINDSQILDLKAGGIYECQISEFLAPNLIGQITASL